MEKEKYSTAISKTVSHWKGEERRSFNQREEEEKRDFLSFFAGKVDRRSSIRPFVSKRSLTLLIITNPSVCVCPAHDGKPIFFSPDVEDVKYKGKEGQNPGFRAILSDILSVGL